MLVSVLEDTGTTLDAKINALDVLADAATPTLIADAVWDEVLSGHVVTSSSGEALSAAGTAADPWLTPIPGAYAAGTAGRKMGDMTSEVSSVLMDTGTTLDAAIAAVKADTAAILEDTSSTLDGKINVIDANVDAVLVDTGTTLDAALAVVDANVDAILVDTSTTLDDKIDAITISAPTAAEVADAVWDEVITSGHVVGGSAAVRLEVAAQGVGTAIAGFGSVANVITVTVNDVPLQDVDVWVTTDSAGVTIAAGTLSTDLNGQVTFYLDPGTYYVWQQKIGYNFNCPDTLIVT